MKKALVLAAALSSSVLYAQTVVFAIGEWEPFTGETMEGYGLSTKVVTKACEKAGLNCEYEFMPWKRAYTMTMKGRVVGTFPWSRGDEERMEQFHHSEQFVSMSSPVIFYEKSVTLPDGAEKDTMKLKDLPLVGINSYTDSEQLKKAGIKIHMVNESKLAWKMMEKGRAKVFIDDLQVGKSECAKFTPGFCANMKTSAPLRESGMHILYPRVDENAKDVMQKLDVALKEMHANGEFAAIMK